MENEDLPFRDRFSSILKGLIWGGGWGVSNSRRGLRRESVVNSISSKNKFVQMLEEVNSKVDDLMNP